MVYLLPVLFTNLGITMVLCFELEQFPSASSAKILGIFARIVFLYFITFDYF